MYKKNICVILAVLLAFVLVPFAVSAAGGPTAGAYTSAGNIPAGVPSQGICATCTAVTQTGYVSMSGTGGGEAATGYVTAGVPSYGIGETWTEPALIGTGSTIPAAAGVTEAAKANADRAGADTTAMCGDIDGDSHVTSADARLCLREAIGSDKNKPTVSGAQDADMDGDLTSADARAILRIAIGLDRLPWKAEVSGRELTFTLDTCADGGFGWSYAADPAYMTLGSEDYKVDESGDPTAAGQPGDQIYRFNVTGTGESSLTLTCAQQCKNGDLLYKCRCSISADASGHITVTGFNVVK